ncbi:MAG: glycoside hydrolase [Firmicutes bacterium]|nr:glycoside hydrolase [Bacillota bacterium]
MKYYENPIKKNGDFADPCVIRYNGRYYLYCTNHDIRCWSSTDLLEWKLEGPVIGPEEFPGLVPFAPEVVYWNGSFYMYTSPHGLGHYVLKSESPTGPFRKISENIGHNIDGSVFIDDDGQWYFYWADFSGIMGCKMKSPTELGEPVNTGAFLHGWTEGAYIVKHNGKYFMTYTGNHYLSNGYRINGAVSEHPLSGYQDDIHNPIVIQTEGKNVGLGHSTSVLGPDLCSYYMIYHNINPDASRDLNIDLQAWHDRTTQVYGPTRTRQVAPQLPDFWTFPEIGYSQYWFLLKGKWCLQGQFYRVMEDEFLSISTQKMQALGCIEINLRCNQGAEKYGMVFGWLDEGHYYKLELECGKKFLEIIKIECDKEYLLKRSILPHDYNETKLHGVRIQCDKGTLDVCIDNRWQMSTEISSMEGHMGYYATKGMIEIGFTAFRNRTAFETEKLWYKPVPGRIPACTALGKVTMSPELNMIPIAKNKQISYHLNIAQSGNYHINLFGTFLTATNWRFYLDEQELGEQAFEAGKRGMLCFPTKLPVGEHVLHLCLKDGEVSLESIVIEDATDLPGCITYEVNKLGQYGKQIWGEFGWSNYVIRTEVKAEVLQGGGEAGLMFRVTQPSEGGEGKDTVLGINFFKGYFVGWNATHLVLSKHAYDKKVLCQREWNFEETELRRIIVYVEDADIQIFVNGEEQPFLTYHDEVPFTNGKIGVRAENGWLEGKIIVDGLLEQRNEE